MEFVQGGLIFVSAKNTDSGHGEQGTASFWVVLTIAFGLDRVGVSARHTLRASLSGTFLQRKDVVNQCLEFVQGVVSFFVSAKNSTDSGQLDRLGVQGTASFWVALRIAFELDRVGVSARHSLIKKNLKKLSAKISTDSGQLDHLGVQGTASFWVALRIAFGASRIAFRLARSLECARHSLVLGSAKNSLRG